jgi:glutathione synthase/RimK-type ligase-like ATP-grasp enzyme
VDLLLATCSGWPDGEPGAEALDAALAARGVQASWAVWDDPAVDWSAVGLVAVRSTWDYVHRPDELIRWARTVESTTPLLNGADVFAWNVDKAYLSGLGDLPVVPTVALDGRSGLEEAVAALGRAAVVKPRVSASGRGVVLVESAADPALAGVPDVPLVVQPLVESIRTDGEHSIFMLDGRACGRVRKVPGAGEIRAHEERGATVGPVPLDDAVVGLAEAALGRAEEITGRRLDYARVDVLRLDGRWVVGELEAVEPGLYLDVLPDVAVPFADLVVSRLSRLR